ncbi:NAD(P)H-hydrate dehydratase [Bacillus massiliglaciei]|uniref:NAD(P)H-hydrate dehydratase n=1 Tax=Bacillus massiliglaciei TaxID=1816693 RepID=UPI000DA61B18|nr:NAD(P)H-hydrate dehydratase [Bacillus massiliglaciei]
MYIYRKADIAEMDSLAEKRGLRTVTLMENAGKALFDAIVRKLGREERILILAGRGNNGGDGIVLARYLKQAGYCTDLYFPLGLPVTEAAEEHLSYFKSLGYEPATEKRDAYSIIIDAMLGAGTRLPLREEVLGEVKWANAQKARRWAVDLPTGTAADHGKTYEAFRANVTFCLHGYKPSAFLEDSADFYGETIVLDIGLPHDSRLRVWQEEDVRASMPKRAGNVHKGTFGNGLLIAGTDAMPGSAMLAGLGAMRSGIGKMTVATTKFVSSIIAGRVPECTFLQDGLEQIAEGSLPEGFRAAAIGPGLADEQLIERAVSHLLRSDLPLVLDAGAIRRRTYPERKSPVIVTPHPGEFSRITGEAVQAIQQNRLDAASRYAEKQGVILVLKGRNTVIAFPDGDLIVNRTGNAGLAKGGTGDTLTGMILAFLSFSEDVKSAVANAVYLHGACADLWKEEKAMSSMLASDLSECLPSVLKKFE